jgi:putative PIN family toxin of toxin-antitoxin system
MKPPDESEPRPCRVVLDTNAVLDWRVFQDARAPALWQGLAARGLRWCATPQMLAEIDAVLTRPLGRRWDAGRERTLSAGFPSEVDLVEPPAQFGHGLRCTDPDDQKFLDLALHLRVRWLVTRDRALLKLRRPAALRGLAILVPEHWPGT